MIKIVTLNVNTKEIITLNANTKEPPQNILKCNGLVFKNFTLDPHPQKN